MIKHEELITIKNVFNELENIRELSEIEKDIITKMEILIEFDDLQTSYDSKRKEISDRLNELNEK